jgi:hypothetical protein
MSLSNNFPNTSPTLMLDFINNDRLDPRITYTRNSPATYVGSSGTIKLVSNNTPRFEYDPVTLDSKGLLIEEDRINLFAYTRDIWNNNWAKRNVSNTVTHMNSITAPDGTLTGTLMYDGAAATGQYIRLDTDNVMANGIIYTSSAFVKKKNSSVVVNNIYTKDPTVANNVYAELNFDTGVVTLEVNGTVTDASAGATQHADGWWRFFVTANSGIGTGAGISTNIAPDGFTSGSGNNSMYLWGMQFEAGAFPTSYMPSVETFTSRSSSGTYYGSDRLIKTAAAGEARYQYNPQNLTAPSALLTEPSRTNLFLYSNSFGTAPWTLENATLSANNIQTDSPDGTTNSTVLIEAGTTGFHSLKQDITTTVDSTYVFSVYVKAKERGNIRMQLAAAGFGTTQYVNFNVTTGVVGNTSGSPKGHMLYVGNDWYRCHLTTPKATAAVATTATIYLADASNQASYTGDGVSGLFLWGSQIESASSGAQGGNVGYTVTSYIDTGAAQVTRSADTFTSVAQSRAQDVVAMTGNNFTSWYNKEQGTFVWSGDISQQTRSAGFRVFDTANSSLRGIGAQLDTRSSGPAYFVSRSTSGTTTITSPGFVTNNQIITMAGSYSNTSNVVAASFFGSTATDTAGYYAFGTENKLDIGGRNLISGTSISNYNGHQRKLVFYPVKVSNDQLSNLTKTLL